MSIVHLVGGEKGGVGKSVVARLLTQLFIDRSLPFDNDTDECRENAGLWQAQVICAHGTNDGGVN